jgi:hypothetical protein
MSDIGDDFKAWDEYKRLQREENLAKALKKPDVAEWEKHTEWHWSRPLAGKRLDYWPTKSKFMWNGVVRVGDVNEFIKRKGGF